MSKKRLVTILLSMIMMISCCAVPTYTMAVEASETAHDPDPYWSLYAHGSTVFNDSANLLYRSNCYGYGFRFFCNSSIPSNDGYPFYRQQPGEFASKSNGMIVSYQLGSSIVTENITNYDELFDYYQKMFGPGSTMTNAIRLSCMQQLVVHDALTLGYTVTKYNGAIANYRATHPNSRLIAMVVGYSSTAGKGDYHFYMQHDDGTWSHKRGAYLTYNTCGMMHDVALTDANVTSHMLEDIYAGGTYVFYEVTKTAVIDYPHFDGHALTSVSTYLPTNDRAGGHVATAQDLGSVPCSYSYGSINYISDNDYYVVTTPAHSGTKTYTITVAPQGSNFPILIMVYSADGTYMTMNMSSTGAAVVNVALNGSTDYVLHVCRSNQTVYDYGAPYSISVAQA